MINKIDTDRKCEVRADRKF